MKSPLIFLNLTLIILLFGSPDHGFANEKKADPAAKLDRISTLLDGLVEKFNYLKSNCSKCSASCTKSKCPKTVPLSLNSDFLNPNIDVFTSLKAKTVAEKAKLSTSLGPVTGDQLAGVDACKGETKSLLSISQQQREALDSAITLVEAIQKDAQKSLDGIFQGGKEFKQRVTNCAAEMWVPSFLVPSFNNFHQVLSNRTFKADSDFPKCPAQARTTVLAIASENKNGLLSDLLAETKSLKNDLVANRGDLDKRIAEYQKVKDKKSCGDLAGAEKSAQKPEAESSADKKTAPPTDKKEAVAKADSKDQAKDPSANKEDGKQAPGQKSPEEIAKEDLTPKAAPYMAPTKILNGPAAAGEALKTAKEEAANGGGGTPPEKLEQADAGALASAGTDGKSEGMGDVADPGRAPTQAEITSEAKLAPLAEAEKKDWAVAQPVLDANRTVASNVEARKLATESFGQDPVLSKYTIDYYSQKDTTAMQKAMNEVLGADSVSVDGRFGPQSYEKLNQIMQDPTKKAALYQALKKDEVWER